jgi:hypothetical protein
LFLSSDGCCPFAIGINIHREYPMLMTSLSSERTWERNIHQ